MKLKLYSVLFISLFILPSLRADGIDFFHGTWNEALLDAKKQDKIIFVDAFTTWCGPCKMMSSKVFPLPEVGDFYNPNFVNVKLDMEKGEGIAFRQKYGVNSFPTLLFIDGDGKEVYRTVGAKNPEDFIKLGEFALTKVDKSVNLDKEYEKGNRSPEFLYEYIKALNKSKKPSLKIANDYLHTQKDLTTDFNLRFILEATTEADSRIFDLLVQNKAKILALTAQADVDKRIEIACKNTLDKAVKFESPDLLNEVKLKIKQISDAKKVALFTYQADRQFYKGTANTAKYLKATDDYLKNAVPNNGEEYGKAAREAMMDYASDKKALAQAEKWATQALKLQANYKHHCLYGEILFKNGKNKEALASAKKAKTLAEKEQVFPSDADALIQKIELSNSKT